MYCPPLAVILRLVDSVGTSYWCLKVDPEHGRPDLYPQKPWAEIAEGDLVVTADGTTYEVDRLVPIEAARGGPPADLVPACREVIQSFAGRSYPDCLESLPR